MAKTPGGSFGHLWIFPMNSSIPQRDFPDLRPLSPDPFGEKFPTYLSLHLRLGPAIQALPATEQAKNSRILLPMLGPQRVKKKYIDYPGPHGDVANIANLIESLARPAVAFHGQLWRRGQHAQVDRRTAKPTCNHR